MFGSLHLERWAFDIEIIKICQLVGIPMSVSPPPSLAVRSTRVRLAIQRRLVCVSRLAFALRLLCVCFAFAVAFALPEGRSPGIPLPGTITGACKPNPVPNPNPNPTWQEVAVNWHEVPGSKLIQSKLDVMTTSATMLRDMLCVKACYMLGIWEVTQNVFTGQKKKR